MKVCYGSSGRFLHLSLLLFLTALPCVCYAQSDSNQHPLMIGQHIAKYDSNGILKPWTSWGDAVAREMNWYNHCRVVNGFPRFITCTFMDDKYHWYKKRADTIPAMQEGMGIISYLDYFQFDKQRHPVYLKIAEKMGDYLIEDCNTPDTGKYPDFTRSTGRVVEGQLPDNCGSQQDKPYEVQPDKGGLAGYALLRLYEATKQPQYLKQALHNARVLVANMGTGDSQNSPWPFRVDYRTGEPDGAISADMSFILRLFNGLNEIGYTEFQKPGKQLWDWIKDYQIPNAVTSGTLWVQFFEDYNDNHNRNSWSAMNLARYLIEDKNRVDSDWKQDAHTLIKFVVKNFTGFRFGVPICGEQDGDREPWGGACSTYGAVLAMYSAATGSNEYKGLAYQALTFVMYAIGSDGCPGQNALSSLRGGWQEDAHTDKIHNFVDAMEAFPQWINER